MLIKHLTADDVFDCADHNVTADDQISSEEKEKFNGSRMNQICRCAENDSRRHSDQHIDHSITIAIIS